MSKRSVLKNDPVIVDAVMGTGVKGELSPEAQNAVEIINSSGAKIVSADIPTGLNADNGTNSLSCVKADITVTMGLPKNGLLTKNGKRFSGKLIIADIGIPKALLRTN